MPYWLLLNVLALAASLRLSGLAAGAGRVARVVAFGQCWCAVQVGALLVAGIAGHLDVPTLIGLEAAILAFAWFTVRPAPGEAPLPAAIGAGLRDGLALLRSDRLLAVAAALVAFFYLWVLVIGALFPPATGDELLYHLPLALSFVQQGNLQVPELSGFWKASLWAWYPANGSLLMSWILLSGSDRLVDLVQWPCALFAAAAVFGIGRQLGAERRAAAWSALLFLAMPLVLNQAKAALNDVLLAFLVLAVLFWVLAYRPGTPWRYGLLAAIPTGLALGIKFTALVQLGLIGLLALGIEWRRHEVTLGQRLTESAIRVGLALAGLALLGGWWYLRNWMEAGSATYPLALLGQVAPSAGRLIDWANYRQAFVDSVAIQPGFNLYNVNYGLGIQVWAWVFPAALVAAAGLPWPRDWTRRSLGLAVLVGYLAWWIVAPIDGAGRYGLPWIALGCALAVPVAAVLTRGDRAWRTLALLMIALSGLLALPGVGADIRSPAIIDGLARLVRTGALPDPYAHRGDLMAYDHREAWGWLAAHTAGSDVAVVNQAFTYPLYGTASPWNRLHYLPAVSRDDWVRRLRENHVAYVITAPLRMSKGSVVTELTATGPRPALNHLSDATNSETSGMRLALSGLPAAALELRYHTAFARPGGGPRPPSGGFYLAVNGGAVFASLAPAVEGPRTVRIPLPTDTRVDDVAIVYLDYPVTEVPIEARLAVDGLALLDAGGAPVATLAAPTSAWALLRRPIEDEWMDELPGVFDLMGTFPDVSAYGADPRAVKIFRVRPAPAGEGAP